jgi:hypothetical protein
LNKSPFEERFYPVECVKLWSGFSWLRTDSCEHGDELLDSIKAKQSRYKPWWRLGGEEVYLLLILEIGIR